MDAAPIDQLITLFLDSGVGSAEFLGNAATGFFELAIWAAIFYGALRITVGEGSLEGSSLQLFAWAIKIFLIGTFGALLLPTIIPALAEGAFGLGTGVSGSTLTAADFLMPSKLFLTGWEEVEKLLKHSTSRINGLYTFAMNAPNLIVYGLAGFVIMASFFVMMCMSVLSYVFFIVEGMGVLVMMGWLASTRTAWLGRGGQATLASRFVQMIVLSAGLSVGTGIFEAVRLSGDPSVAQAVLSAACALVLAVLAWNSERIGAAIIGGTAGPGSAAPAGQALTMVGGMLGLGAAATMDMGRRMTGGGGSTPDLPTGGGSPGTGSGHGGNPYGSGGGGGAARSASVNQTPTAGEWRGKGPGGLGEDIGGMGSDQAVATISARAKSLPQGNGADSSAPTDQQWRDAQIMGTDITGMTRGQAGAALDAHRGWFETRNGGSPSPTLNASAPTDSAAAPADWLTQGSRSSRTVDGWANTLQKAGVDASNFTPEQGKAAADALNAESRYRATKGSSTPISTETANWIAQAAKTPSTEGQIGSLSAVGVDARGMTKWQASEQMRMARDRGQEPPLYAPTTAQNTKKSA